MAFYATKPGSFLLKQHSRVVWQKRKLQVCSFKQDRDGLAMIDCFGMANHTKWVMSVLSWAKLNISLDKYSVFFLNDVSF